MVCYYTIATITLFYNVNHLRTNEFLLLYNLDRIIEYNNP